ncbi:hypothetical protein ATE92_2239 [Ulvibacter sp. MAR_2010_11]|uniref:DUF6146 family protein n=1 Tax=Ulvibacter sp. MAR_2010_11 TaxID=1250229 RepID=UPI000C2C23E2|nr:DUF6146 family protein [Ulvibacter sp. MAR_2010_11]PKA84069.1 hypothetical protein ATE92_2239 [Ulvibacter sp. MAR_2010_11]
MKYLLAILIVALGIYSCESSKSSVEGVATTGTSDTLRIANDSLEYEILIIEPGFDSWLVTQPPKGFNGIGYLETRNYQYVLEYNNRVYNPSYSKTLYPQQIDYDPNIHYGLEVNYLLYNYFKYFEQKYKQKLR